jgi:hypothetical protein
MILVAQNLLPFFDKYFRSSNRTMYMELSSSSFWENKESEIKGFFTSIIDVFSWYWLFDAQTKPYLWNLLAFIYLS